MKEARASFSGKLGYIMAAAGSAMGLGNIWRFPYLAAKYGGGIFLICYILLVATCGCALVITEVALGRMTRKSPIGAFAKFGSGPFFKIGGWFNAIIPMIIVPYYCVIGGWVLKYLVEYILGHGDKLANGEYFSTFIGNSGSVEMWFIIYALINLIIILNGVNKGIESVSKFMMPSLLVLALFIAIYSCTRPGAGEGIKYFLVPNFNNFSTMTLVAAAGQMFYSLSIAMGILCTYGSYTKKNVNIESSSYQIASFDTSVAVLGGLMVIPAVFAFSGGDPNSLLQKGPALAFITLPKVFHSMRGGDVIAILFFAMFLFSALTSSISLFETCTSVFQDEVGTKRSTSAVLIGALTLFLGTLSALSYGAFANVKIIGMHFLDFFDFLANTILLPIAALFLVFLVIIYAKPKKIIEEVEISSLFNTKKLYEAVIKYIAPVVIFVILVVSILEYLGVLNI